MSLFLGYSVLVSFWTVLVGCLLGLWEFPGLYFFIPQAPDIAEYFLTKLRIEQKMIRAVMYFFLSLFCFTNQTPCIAAGLCLMVSAVLHGFAQVNDHSDSIDGTVNIGKSTSSTSVSEKTGLVSPKDFGTF